MAIAKIHLNDSPRETFSYCFCKAGARIVGGNVAPRINRDDLSDDEATQIIEDAANRYQISLSQNPSIARPVYHISLALPHHESLSDEDFARLSDRYLAGLILSSTDRSILDDAETFATAVDDFVTDGLPAYQYAQVIHTDRDHLHLHQVVARPDLVDGTAIATGHDHYRSQVVLRYLEAEFGLERQRCSWEPKAPQEQDAISRLREAITTAAQDQPELSVFINRLHDEGIAVQRKKGQIIYTLTESETSFREDELEKDLTLKNLGIKVPRSAPKRELQGLEL